MDFHYMIYMGMSQHKKPCPWGHEIYNFGKPFFGHHNCILNLSDLCLGVQKTLFEKRIMHFKYNDLKYITMPQYKNSGPGVMKVTMLVNPSLVIITIHLFCLNHAHQQRRRLKKPLILHFISPNYLPQGQGDGIYNLLSPYPTDATYQIWTYKYFLSRIYVNARRTTNAGRRTTMDANPQQQVT